MHRSSLENVLRRHFEIEGEVLIVTPGDDKEPSSVQKALSCPAKDKWMKVMEEEMESIRSNHVWNLVDLSSGRKAIGNK